MQNEYIAKESLLQEQANQIKIEKKNQKKIIDSKVFEIEQKLKKAIYLELTQKIEEENKTRNELLSKEIDRKNQQLESFSNSEIEHEKLKFKLNQDFMDQISKLKKDHLLELQKNSDFAKKSIADDYELKIRELEKKLENQKLLAEEQKRKLDQGSMQLQGEVQEEAIEDFLNYSFPIDEITLIKKGSRGADCLQVVKNDKGFKSGSIYYESKRTQSFKNEWITKLRKDMQSKNADIGVLVTKTLPRDTERMKWINGIYVCTFDEFKGLSHILRIFILEFYKNKISKENIVDKKQLLYNYLTSNEFQIQIQNIIELFKEKNENLNKDYDFFIKSFQRRRGNYDSLKELILSVFGRFEGISGSNIKAIDVQNENELDKASNMKLLSNI